MPSDSQAARPRAGINAVAPLAPNARLRYDVVERMLPDGVTDVLEIGCGQGSVGARLAQRYHYLGLEPDPASWELARQRLRAGSAAARSATSLFPATWAPNDLTWSAPLRCSSTWRTTRPR